MRQEEGGDGGREEREREEREGRRRRYSDSPLLCIALCCAAAISLLLLKRSQACAPALITSMHASVLVQKAAPPGMWQQRAGRRPSREHRWDGTGWEGGVQAACHGILSLSLALSLPPPPLFSPLSQSPSKTHFLLSMAVMG